MQVGKLEDLKRPVSAEFEGGERRLAKRLAAVGEGDAGGGHRRVGVGDDSGGSEAGPGRVVAVGEVELGDGVHRLRAFFAGRSLLATKAELLLHPLRGRGGTVVEMQTLLARHHTHNFGSQTFLNYVPAVIVWRTLTFFDELYVDDLLNVSTARLAVEDVALFYAAEEVDSIPPSDVPSWPTGLRLRSTCTHLPSNASSAGVVLGKHVVSGKQVLTVISVIGAGLGRVGSVVVEWVDIVVLLSPEL